MDDELHPEYGLHKQFKSGVRGKYYKQACVGTNLALLAPDGAKAFANNAEAVNEVLVLVIQLTKVPLCKKQRLAKLKSWLREGDPIMLGVIPAVVFLDSVSLRPGCAICD